MTLFYINIPEKRKNEHSQPIAHKLFQKQQNLESSIKTVEHIYNIQVHKINAGGKNSCNHTFLERENYFF